MVELNGIEKDTCRKLFISYSIIEVADNELIEPIKNIDSDVLDTYFGMTFLLKNDRKRKFNETEEKNSYVYYRYLLNQ